MPINSLAAKNLDPSIKNHFLKGSFKKEHRECHIKPDWLLIYRIEENDLVFVRTVHIQICSSNPSIPQAGRTEANIVEPAMIFLFLVDYS